MNLKTLILKWKKYEAEDGRKGDQRWGASRVNTLKPPSAR